VLIRCVLPALGSELFYVSKSSMVLQVCDSDCRCYSTEVSPIMISSTQL